MKLIKYNLCTIVDGEEILSPVTMGWSEVNEEIAKREAHNGGYTIEDDGQLENEPTVTVDDVLDTLLGVTV